MHTLKVCKTILKDPNPENEGRDPASIFKGPEALGTHEHRWHTVAFLI